MLSAFARHSRTDLAVSVAGDLEVDGHHSVEDRLMSRSFCSGVPMVTRRQPSKSGVAEKSRTSTPCS